ncbi:N-acetylmuramoyl-L-alanine amidase [Luteolibacter pohnpeiensis]|uniref:N-acetylmuramoyl-L-alanine amidase n=1 Tax=Luteolibacter pohnpeiensis TaxID=454153 RepID=A0A934VRR4_9BACT|nr:N-acetylmuramoyl-L-alanine amidase [Luteolibacter pohnpeiensis]MBK1883491.1 N-acetylmuramoyl-L-alanine amidase [Luteolibacter pohnpeiensis]
MAVFPHPKSLLRLCLSFLTTGLITIGTGFPTAAHAENEAGWDVTKINGKEYVAVEGVKNFYKFTSFKQSGDRLVLDSKSIEMKLQVGAQECLMNNVKFILSNPVVEQGSKTYVSRLDLTKLIDPVLRPQFISDAGNFRTIILDPGHGGKDPGSTNSIGTEANYTLKLAYRVKAILESRPERFRVIMTRDSDRYVSLQGRVDIANAVQENALFISLHFNSGGRSARGIETFTLSPPGVAHYGRGVVAADSISRAGNQHDSANIALATAVHGYTLRLLQKKGVTTFDRGIKRARFSVLSGVRHPAILFEGGFMSNPYEAKLISSDAYQNLIAESVVYAVECYRSNVSTATAGRR